MKNFFGPVLSLAILLGVGVGVYHRLSGSLNEKTPQAAPAPAVSELEASLQTPPVPQEAEGFPVVNQQRLYELAGQPGRKGPSPRVSASEFEQMVASQRRVNERIPASEGEDKAAPAKGSKKNGKPAK